MNEDDECCILCKCEFTRGYITQWYVQPCLDPLCLLILSTYSTVLTYSARCDTTCLIDLRPLISRNILQSCMKSWLERKEGKACPVCRVPISPDQLERFAVADSGSKTPTVVPPRIVNNEPVPRSRRTIEYNMASSSLTESIDMMESHGSFGSKIQTLVRHLLYLQVSDPGCKTIVFSAWADSLNSKYGPRMRCCSVLIIHHLQSFTSRFSKTVRFFQYSLFVFSYTSYLRYQSFARRPKQREAKRSQNIPYGPFLLRAITPWVSQLLSQQSDRLLIQYFLVNEKMQV